MAQSKTKGIVLLVCSSFFFATMSAFVRMSGELPSVQKMVFRNAVSAVVAAVILLKRHEAVKVPQESVCPLIIRCLCGLGAVVCNYYAIDRLMLANSNSLSKLSPFFAIGFASFFLGDRLNKRQTVSIFLAAIGAFFLVFPGLKDFGVASVVGFLGGALSGGAHVALRDLKNKNQIDNSVIVFIFSSFGLIAVLIPAVFVWREMTAQQWVCLLLAGSACAIAQFCLTGAYKMAAPKEISLFDFSQLIFSAIYGYIIFSQIPGIYSLIAYAFILAASIVLFYSNVIVEKDRS